MLLRNTDENYYSDVVNTRGNEDYVSNGKIYKNSSMQMVLVSSENDLSLLDKYAPGTIAHTAGFTSMWQKSASGEWIPV